MNVTRSAGLALAAILLSTSLASAGSFLDFGSGGGDGGSSGGDSILDMIDDPSDEPDQNFDPIFNPKPEIAIRPELIDMLNDDPQIQVVDLGIAHGHGNKPAPGKVRLDAKVKFGAVLTCVVSGTPSEFPDDIRIANAGVVALPAGTDIKWQAAGIGGVAGLGKALQPGKSIKLSNVLPGGVEAGTVCSAKAIGL